MKRKRVEPRALLAVSLPAEAPRGLRLDEAKVAEVSAQPQTGAEIIRAGSREFEGGRVTKRFRKLATSMADRYAASFRKLAK